SGDLRQGEEEATEQGMSQPEMHRPIGGATVQRPLWLPGDPFLATHRVWNLLPGDPWLHVAHTLTHSHYCHPGDGFHAKGSHDHCRPEPKSKIDARGFGIKYAKSISKSILLSSSLYAVQVFISIACHTPKLE